MICVDEDVAAFHEKERIRWDVVYEEVYKETPQEFCASLPSHGSFKPGI